MTTIAFKDGVLAADSLIFSNHVRSGFVKKIVRLNSGALIAGAGEWAMLMPYAEWFNADQPGSQPANANFTLLHVNQYGLCRVYESGGWLDHDPAEPWANGSGGTIALVAMHCGKSAVEAVRLAIKLDSGSGGMVHAGRIDHHDRAPIEGMTADDVIV